MPGPAGVQHLKSVEDIDRITFSDGLAAVEVPLDLLESLPLRNEVRQNGPRLKRMVHSIRRHGYRPLDPIICRVGMKGRWVLVDGGHRITAVRRLRKSCVTRLLGPRIDTLYFLLFTTPGSWSKVREMAGPRAEIGGLGPQPLPEAPPAAPEPD